MELPREMWDLIEEYEQMQALADHKKQYKTCMKVIRHYGRIFPYYESLTIYTKCIDLILLIAEQEILDIQTLATLYQKQCQ